MKKFETVFITTIFPTSEAYLDDFFNSLLNQTHRDFDVLVINDGVDNFDLIRRKYADLNFIEIKVSESIPKNREIGINTALDLKYNFIIFGDSDDYFSINRVEESLKKLVNNDIVVNELTLFNDADIFDVNYFSNRIESGAILNSGLIRNKNIFGLSNTAVNTSKLSKVKFNEELIAVDWYLFSRLLLKGMNAIFTADCTTFYRQYNENTVGIGLISRESIMKGIDVKLKHYESLKKDDDGYYGLYVELLQLKQAVKEDGYLDKLIKQEISNPFWWEEIRLL